MGSWVDSKVGYGLRLPSEEDVEYKPSEWAMQFYSEEDEQITDWYELGEALEDRFPGTEFIYQYVHDYSAGSVLMIGRRSTDYTGIGTVEMVPATPEHYGALKQVAELLDIPFDPQWYVVVSYG